MKRKFSLYGFWILMIYLCSIAIWIVSGIALWKAIDVHSAFHLIAWFMIWQLFSGIIIAAFMYGSSKLLRYVD